MAYYNIRNSIYSPTGFGEVFTIIRDSILLKEKRYGVISGKSLNSPHGITVKSLKYIVRDV
jgi:hypothetical protein